MEPINNEIECLIDEEWKFHRADLLALKDIKNGYLSGKTFYAYNIPGLQYFLTINPYVNEENYEQVRILLYINGSQERKITANFVISIKSANYISKHIGKVYEANYGYGLYCIKSDDFMDLSKKFFVNGEITIGIKGILKAPRALVTKLSSPISCEWKIKESDLLPLKESNYKCLKSKRFIVSSFSDVKYFLEIYPNGYNGDYNQGNAYIFLQIQIGNENKIEATYDFSIKSANYYYRMQYNFETSVRGGTNICSTNDLFDTSKKFVVNGYLTVRLNGILMVENKNQITTLKIKKGVATQADEKNKEFTIFVDGKQIKVHKKVLSDASPVFAGMLESGMKESIENKMDITDFTFDIIDAAIKLCYSSDVRKLSSIEDMFSLYKFADKYQIELIMNFVEEELTEKISPANVCQIIGFSQSRNVSELHKKCVEFLMKCAKDATPVYGTNILEKDLIVSIFFNCLCPVAETDI